MHNKTWFVVLLVDLITGPERINAARG
jgi:hypothetical protein